MAGRENDAPFDAETMAFYGKNAPSYVASGPGGQNRFLGHLMSRLRTGARILDVGCGGGIDARAMLDAGFLVDAIDASCTIARATTKRIGIEVEVKRFDEIEAVGEYDGVWASASLIHVPRPALPGVLGRVFRALKPGGFHVATYKSGGIEGRDGDGRYYNYPGEADLLAAYQASGSWEIDRIEGYTGGGFPDGNGPWLVIEARRPVSDETPV